MTRQRSVSGGGGGGGSNRWDINCLCLGCCMLFYCVLDCCYDSLLYNCVFSGLNLIIGSQNGIPSVGKNL